LWGVGFRFGNNNSSNNNNNTAVQLSSCSKLPLPAILNTTPQDLISTPNLSIQTSLYPAKTISHSLGTRGSDLKIRVDLLVEITAIPASDPPVPRIHITTYTPLATPLDWRFRNRGIPVPCCEKQMGWRGSLDPFKLRDQSGNLERRCVSRLGHQTECPEFRLVKLYFAYMCKHAWNVMVLTGCSSCNVKIQISIVVYSRPISMC
jgi:hypothetical protein